MDDKRQGRCELCGKSPRSLRQLESGQWVCHTCLKAFRPPKSSPNAPATEKQVSYARRLGIHLPPGCTKADASKHIGLVSRQFPLTDELLTENINTIECLHDDVMYYVMDAWEQCTGARPKQAGIPWKDQQQFGAMLIARWRQLAESCANVQRWRDEESSERFLDYAEEHPRGTREQRSFRPAIPNDETYQTIIGMLVKRWKKYRPSLLARLFGR